MSAPTPGPNGEARAETSVTAAIENMIAIIDQIVEITEEENQHYANGFPAPPTGIVAMKQSQANLLQDWFDGLRHGQFELERVEPRLRSSLLARVKRMHSVMEENAGRLAKARAASRRRIDAIMHVVREQTRPRSTAYGNSGQMTERTGGQRAVQFSTEI
ncbi:MAG: hypothetical protein C0606_05470 [Hyphomicrobiales bacterium]|nr:MAG: hypothetical protein C0606_05470 [Hyphomicrobiales bacterium]